VTSAPLFLAAGISAESYVVLGKVTDSKIAAAGYAAASFLVLMIFWYVLPLIIRITSYGHKP
jgi:hypothetical protein